MDYKRIILKPGKEQSLRRHHPWVFSGAIANTEAKIYEGEIVDIYSNKNEFLGCGYYQSGSIAVRMLSFTKTKINDDFWYQKIINAKEYRESVNIKFRDNLNVFRLIHAEGDGIPGLIVDLYNNIAVFQAHTSGIYYLRNVIAEVLLHIYKSKLNAVFDKSKDYLIHEKEDEQKPDFIINTSNQQVFQSEVTENGHRFIVDFEKGQKTGFFIDQRENRHLLSTYSKDKSVLNTFSYTGAFSIYALKAGAKLVHSVDSSEYAIELCTRNVSINNLNSDKHIAYCSDVFEFIKGKKFDYDIIIIDPPAFAKHIDMRHKATIGYKTLNASVFNKVKKGTMVFTFSCSQAVDRQLFENTIRAAAIETDRKIRILHRLSQPVDHPVSIYHPESEYLKGLVLYVE